MISLYNVCSILCYFIKVGIFFNQTFELQSSRTCLGAGEFLSKKLLTAEDDLNNIPDGWYYYMNTVNPQNTPQYADNSLLYQISVVDTRTFRFQILLSENAKCVFFRGMANGGEWTVWNRFSFVLKQ